MTAPTQQIDPTIYHFIAVPDWQPHDATLMQGFAPTLARNSWMFEGTALSPANAFDFSPEGIGTFLARRMAGSFPIHIHPQSPRAIRAMPVPAFMPFVLYFLPDEEKAQDYADWAKSCEVRPTLVAKTGGDVTFNELSLENVQRLFLGKLEKMPADIDPVSIADMQAAIGSWKPLPDRKLAFRVPGHGSIRPNVAVLRTAGYSDIVSGPMKNIDRDWKPYVEPIVLTANAILDEREAVGAREMQRIFRTPPDLNLYAPSIYPHFFDLPVPPGLAPDEQRRFRATREALRTQSGYSFTAESPAQMTALFSTNADGTPKQPRPHPIFWMRAEEVNFGTAVITVLAASEFSAVLRMPNDINRTSGTIRGFAQQSRSRAPASRKRLLAFRQVQDRLNTAFPAEFKDVVRRSKSGVRIVSDAHVEWLDLDGLPLMLRKTCSRIPVTPGNLFVTQASAQEIIHLTPQSLSKILVLDALKADDPISGIFDEAFETFEKRWKGKLQIKKVPVASEDDFVNAINAFDGDIMVFDGHGGHDPKEPGKLYFQDQGVDIWGLGPKLKRIPPIIFLSACDTHAADRNHATIANGFLNLGARAVLAAVFPIDARSAAIFTARFLYRIADYLRPAIRLFGQALRWSDVVSGMLRMQILTEYLRALRRQGLIDARQYHDVHVAGNIAINSDHPAPFAHVDSNLETLGIKSEVLKPEMAMVVANSDVISYLHLGRPETILVDDPTRVDAQLAEMHLDEPPIDADTSEAS